MTSRNLSLVRTGATTDSEPVVLLHGFTQTAECWGPFADDLGRRFPIVAVDLPGHGGSLDVRADLVDTAHLVASDLQPSTLIGYSLGGRVALHLALQRPDLVQRLVLIGATGGIDDSDERNQRRAADEKLADHLEDIGVDAFLDEWLAQPLFATLSPEQSRREIRRTNSAKGLASSLRQCGTGTQEPLWGRLHQLSMPVLVIAGTLDKKFTELGHRFVEAIGVNASFIAIDDAGHSAQLEKPEETATAIIDWLSQTE